MHCWHRKHCTYALEIHEKYAKKGTNMGVVDLYRLKPLDVKNLTNCLKKYKYIISWEEHLLAGGLGSILSEFIMDNNLPVELKRFGIDDRYCYLYQRENIQKQINIDLEAVENEINSLIS